MRNKYKTLIISCWIVLIACFLIKIFGGNWFEIICENENFINICEWLDSGWIKYIVMTLMYIPLSYIPYLAMVNKSFCKDWWIILLVLPCSILKVYLPIIAIIIDLSVLIVIPLIICKFKNWKKVIIVNILMVIFQLISLFTKNIGYYMPNDSILISLIFSIDYYIMTILCYLYCRKELN